MNTRYPSILAGPVIVIACLLAVSWKTAAAAPIEWTPYELVARDGAKVLLERGAITVPENRAKPDGRQIKLGFVRFAATRPTTNPPIIYLAGGPGGSGVDAARLPMRFAIFQALREVADVIAFDQRGTGFSNEIPPCPAHGSLPLDRPTTRQSLTAAVQAVARTCAKFWKDAGIDLSGYDTLESAADVDALREALGVPKVSLWGISYGSHLGLAILKRYPQHIERAVFVGIEGLDETVKLPALVDAFYARLQNAIDSDPEAARAYPDFTGTVRRVHAKLEREPAIVTFKVKGEDVTLTLGRTDAEFVAVAMGSDPGRSRMLPGLYAMMDAGDFSRVAPIAYDSIRKPDALGVSGMGDAMDVASGISAARARLVERQARTALVGDLNNFPMPHMGTALGVPDLGESFRAPFRSSVPTLFMSGTLDGRTFPESARELIKRFSNGSHLIVENGGHNLFEASPLIKGVVVDWFEGKAPKAAKLSLPTPEFPH